MCRSFVWDFDRDRGIGLTCVMDVQVGLANRQ